MTYKCMMAYPSMSRCVQANLAVAPSLRVMKNTVLLSEASGIQLTTNAGSVHLEQSSESHWFKLHKRRSGLNEYRGIIITGGGLLFLIVGMPCFAKKDGKYTFTETEER